MDENLKIMTYKVFKNNELVAINTVPMGKLEWAIDSLRLIDNPDEHIIFECDDIVFEMKLTEYRT